MKVILLKSCLGLLPTIKGGGQLQLTEETRASTVKAITAPARADAVLGDEELRAGDAVVASHSLMVDELTVRDCFGRDWPMSGDFLSGVELIKAGNYVRVEPPSGAQTELECVQGAVLSIRWITVCALLAGDDFETALLNGAHFWARRTLYLGVILQTGGYDPAKDIVWGVVPLLSDDVPEYVLAAAKVIDAGTVLGLNMYAPGNLNLVQVADSNRIAVEATQHQLDDICKAAVMAGMLGDEKWVDMSIAAASVMLMYRRGVSTAEISMTRSADVLDCLDEEGEGEIGAALSQLWAFEMDVAGGQVARQPHWAGSYEELKTSARRHGVKIRRGTGIEMIVGVPDEIRTEGRERLFIEDGVLRKKRGKGIVERIVALVNHAPKVSVLGNSVELERIRAPDSSSSTTLLSVALSGGFGAEVGVWALSKVLTGGIKIADGSRGIWNASYAVDMENGGGTVAQAYVHEDIMRSIAVYDDGEDVLLHVVNSQIYLKLRNEANGTMCAKVMRRKIKVLRSGVLSRPKKLG